MEPAELHARAKALALELLELERSERDARLAKIGGDQPELVAEVRSWLGHLDTDTALLKPSLDLPADEAAELLSHAGLHEPVAAVAPRQFVSGQEFAERYTIGQCLGRGGMGEVWAARDETLGVDVALKFLHQNLGGDDWRQRLRDEVLAARRISHPNVCRVHDLSEVHGELFVSMQLVPGPDLAERIRRGGPLARAETRRLAFELTSALASIHDGEILHRDLKPGNVLFDASGAALISDFGLAASAKGKLTSAGSADAPVAPSGDSTDSPPTLSTDPADPATSQEAQDSARPDSSFGTRAYMAPELLEGMAPTRASDLFALGLVLYEAVTGRRAFRTAAAILRAGRTGRLPVPPSTYVKDVDPVLERVITRCLSGRPEDRPKSAAHIATVLAHGDPLEAVLELGEQPSPEVISSARTRGLLTPARAAALIAVTWMLLLFASSMTPGSLPAQEPAQLAASIHARFASAIELPAPLPHSYTWVLEPGHLAGEQPLHLQAPDAAAVMGPPIAWRDSPNPLSPISIASRLLSAGRVQIFDPPPPLVAGHLWIADSTGRIAFYRDHGPAPDDSEPLTQQRIDELIVALGLDPSSFASTTPAPDRQVEFGLANSTRVAWQQPNGARLELAHTAGHIQAFELLWPNEGSHGEDTGGLTGVAVLLLLLIVGVPLSLVNLRRGGSDPFGAFRIAVAVFLATSFGWALSADWPGDIISIGLFALSAIEIGLLAAVLIWILYMAAEPLMQRAWPRCLITWTRFTRGQFRDPVVLSHILIGITVAALEVAIHAVFDPPDYASVPAALTQGAATTSWLGSLFRSLFEVLLNPLQFAAALAILGLLLRNRWLTLVVVLALASVVENEDQSGTILLATAITLIDVALLLRYGLLALAAAYGIFNLRERLNIGLPTADWHASATYSCVALVFAIQVACFLGITFRKRRDLGTRGSAHAAG